MRYTIVVLLSCLTFLPAQAQAEESPRHFVRERARAEQALRTLARGRTLPVSWSVLHARPVTVHGLAEPTRGTSHSERALYFLARHPDLFPAPAQLVLLEVDGAGGSHFVRFQQFHRGLPVDGAQVVVTLGPRGQVRSVTNEAASLDLASVTPTLSAATALTVAVKALRLPPELARAGAAQLAIRPEGGGRLIYRVQFPFPADPSGRAHFIDAQTGAFLGSRTVARIERLAGSHGEVRP